MRNNKQLSSIHIRNFFNWFFHLHGGRHFSLQKNCENCDVIFSLFPIQKKKSPFPVRMVKRLPIVIEFALLWFHCKTALFEKIKRKSGMVHAWFVIEYLFPSFLNSIYKFPVIIFHIIFINVYVFFSVWDGLKNLEMEVQLWCKCLFLIDVSQ